MRRALEDYNKASGNSFKIGIGIHAGEAVVGNIGSKERISYTALGDTVNVSSRVEGLTKQYGADILVTQEVVDAVQSDRYTFTYIDTISVKGRGKQVILYTVAENI
jgi:adenylate cyclase